ncbi:MAG: tRNA (adenosine(37)-N6)-threonylcarbamoyltransferase complex dimerization subunit type 1 TsaB [candidate division KSB1 bacterium]|nr:tRNA (adenosine(37)-N6)-threonylcarbamoyltransferase complex dimerization subunit type 1 TsaB [candidate division KSB1 bacterium]
MLHLGIETATPTCAVALLTDDTLLAESRLNIRNVHASRLFQLIDSLFRHADRRMQDLNAVSVSIGPGSFTGLRIGLASAKGIATGLDIPVIPVPTLSALARQAPAENGRLYPFIRARKNEYYTAPVLRTDWDDHIGEVMIVHPENVEEKLKTPCMLIGDTRELNISHPDIHIAPAFAHLHSALHVALTGRDLYLQGDLSEFDTLIPLYGQDFVAEKPKKRA